MGRIYTTGPHGEAIPIEPDIKTVLNINFETSSKVELSSVLKMMNEYYNPVPVPSGKDMFGSSWPDVDFEYYDKTEQKHAYLNTRGTIVKPMTMLAMRMRWGDYAPISPDGQLIQPFLFDHVSIHLNDEKAFVFVVVDGKSTVIEDQANLFPSDTLVTQLNLLKTGT